MENQNGSKSYETSTGRYALHGKKKQQGKKKNKDKGQRMKVPRRWMLMDRIWQYVEVVKVTWITFSEVFCVVIFFSSTLHFCTPRKNTEMENIIKDWKKEQTLSVTFPKRRFQSKHSFFWNFFLCVFFQSFFCFCFCLYFFLLRAAFLYIDIWEGNSPSLVS